MKPNPVIRWAEYTWGTHAPLAPCFAHAPAEFRNFIACNAPDIRRFDTLERHWATAPEWKNELALVFIAGLLREDLITGGAFKDYILGAAMTLRHISRLAGGRVNVVPDYHCDLATLLMDAPPAEHARIRVAHRYYLKSAALVQQYVTTLCPAEREVFEPFMLPVPSADGAHLWLWHALPTDLRSLLAHPHDRSARRRLPIQEVLNYLRDVVAQSAVPWFPHFSMFALETAARHEEGRMPLHWLRVMHQAMLTSWEAAGRPITHDLSSMKVTGSDLGVQGLQQLSRTFWNLAEDPAYADLVQRYAPPFGPEISFKPNLGWANFEGFADPAVLQVAQHALPRGQEDSERRRALDDQLATLWRRARTSPFLNHLLIAATALLTNQDLRPNTINNQIVYLRKLLDRLNQQGGSLADGRAVADLLDVPVDATTTEEDSVRRQATAYRTVLRQEVTFLARHKDFSALLGPWLLPALPVRPAVNRRYNRELWEQRQTQRDEVDNIADIWEDLHQLADRRLCAMRAVASAYRNVTRTLDLASMTGPHPLTVPIPGTREVWRFRVWSKLSYLQYVTRKPPRRHLKMKDQFFLEYVGAECADGQPEGMWCEDVLTTRINPAGAAEFKARWGYSIKDFSQSDRGVLGNSIDISRYFSWRGRELQDRGEALPCLFEPESVYLGVLFAALALRLIKYGGHRAHEVLQLRLEEEFLFAKTLNVREVMFMVLFPKNHKGTRRHAARPAYKVVSEEAFRLVSAINNCRLIAGQQMCRTLPDRFAGFGSPRGEYVFQWHGRGLGMHALNSCLRFLLHGLPTDGELARVRAHLLRYAFANHAKESGIPVLDLALAMNHRNTKMTEHYARPTRRQEQRIISSVALGAREPKSQSPLQFGFNAAQIPGVEGSVPGGQCTHLAPCTLSRGCIGCPMKAPDPGRRSETEAYLQMVEPQFQQAYAAGWLDSQRLAAQVKEAKAELQKMARIEALTAVEQALEEAELRFLESCA